MGLILYCDEGFEKSNATVRRTVACEGLTEQLHNLLPAGEQMQTKPLSTPEKRDTLSDVSFGRYLFKLIEDVYWPESLIYSLRLIRNIYVTIKIGVINGISASCGPWHINADSIFCIGLYSQDIHCYSFQKLISIIAIKIKNIGLIKFIFCIISKIYPGPRNFGSYPI